MAGIYDTHTHLNDVLYEEHHVTAADLIKQSKAMGVDLLNIVGVDVQSSRVALRLATQFSNVHALVGIHPNEADKIDDKDLKAIFEMANSKFVIGIGEVGLDYSRTNETKDKQIILFKKQIEIAKELNLPLVIHVKDKEGHYEAYRDVYKILVTHKVNKAILHSYEGHEDYAKKFLKLGYLLSFSGKITYGSRKLEKVVRNVSLNQILIESDAPYYAPVPYEKEINFPVNTNLIAEKIAQIKKIDVDEIISATRTNGQTFFQIK
jgi:TatD DNase family protein